MRVLKVGESAPDFSLSGSDGKQHALAMYKGKWLVVYFYPRDNTPGCTQEACDFRDMKSDYDNVDAIVFGVSVDSIDSHDKFIKKFGLPFVLLSDEKKEVVGQYGVWKEKSMYGKKYFGIERTSFVIDPEGKIAKIFEKVKVEGHAAEVMAFLKEKQQILTNQK